MFIHVKCPFCGSADVGKCGHAKGKQRYLCKNVACTHKTFYAEYTYNGCKPKIEQEIIRWSAGGAGTRAISRELKVSADTVIAVLKRQKSAILDGPLVLC